MFGEENFTATTNQTEDIKREFSVLGLDDQEKVKSIADDIHSLFLGRYKVFISKDTQRKKENIRDRIIVIDRNSFPILHQRIHNVTLEGDISGWRTPRGDLIFIQKPIQYWENMEESSKKSAAERLGSEEKAKEVYGWIGLAGTLAHEIAHSLADNNGYGNRLPFWFEEAGARYYARIAEKELLADFLVGYYSAQQIRLYEALINEYGEEIHRLFFGDKIDPQLKERILSSVNREEITRVFPGFKSNILFAFR